jgi:DNA invertase Pin-like site-specific DNA recombinase
MMLHVVGSLAEYERVLLHERTRSGLELARQNGRIGAGAAEVELTPDDLQEIEDAASKITIQGARLPEALLKMSE